jgi:hypothetical protein
MCRLLFVAILALPIGCAHHEPNRNLAQRSPPAPPRSDFEGAPRDQARDRALQRVEKPIVTPPVP